MSEGTVAPCPDENQLAAFVAGSLHAHDDALTAHVEACEECQSVLVVLARTMASEQNAASVAAVPGEPNVSGDLLANRFALGPRLGRGTMGVVYEAYDTELKVTIALKLLRPEIENDPRYMKQLNREIVLGRSITHPGVCRIFDLGTSGRLRFITMERVWGRTLDKELHHGRVTKERGVDVFVQICQALAAAHDHGVVHRDLKPANITITPEGRVKVMDFGLARDLNAHQSESGVAVGTPAYWSPEQAAGRKASVQSDLYSLGVLACDLFGAPRPVLGQAAVLDAVPKAFRRVIANCLEPQVDKRPRSTREILGALHAAQRGKAWLRWAIPSAVATIAVVAGAIWTTRTNTLLETHETTPLVEHKQPIEPLAALSPKVAPEPPRPSDRHAKNNKRAEVLFKHLTERGLLLEDLPEGTSRFHLAQAAMEQERPWEALPHLKALETTAANIEIDKAFVEAKLQRVVEKSGRSLSSRDTQAWQSIAAKVHASFFAHDYVMANAEINKLWQLLQTASTEPPVGDP